MDLHLVVGGLIVRNAVLSALLVNYAERVEHGTLGQGMRTAPCFIVPTWNVDQVASVCPGNQLLRVEAHASRTEPRHHETLDTVLRLLHGVLTDDRASTCITARRLHTSPAPVISGLGTVARMGIWAIAPLQCPPERIPRRLLPWPDYSTSSLAAASPTPGALCMN